MSIDWRIKKGSRFKINAKAKDLWLKDYDCKVNCVATVLEDTTMKSKKVLVSLSEINGEYDVAVQINKRYLFDEIIETKYD